MFEQFPLLLCLQVLVAQSLGLVLSTVFTDVFAAHSFAAVLTLMLMLFGLSLIHI